MMFNCLYCKMSEEKEEFWDYWTVKKIYYHLVVLQSYWQQR